MKTALQEYKEWLKSFYASYAMIGDAAYNSMQSKATELLHKEKEQIRNAFNQGYREGEEDGKAGIYAGKKDVSEYNDSIYYYNKTYNQ